MTYWHYTNGRHILAIIADGVLKTADDGSGATPLVWFSCNPGWEMAASRYVQSPLLKSATNCNGLVVLNREQMALYCGGVFRVGVDADSFPLHKWPDLIEHAGISEIARERHMAGANWVNSNPLEWAGSLAPVSMERWTRIEYFDGGERRLLDADYIKSRFDNLYRAGKGEIMVFG